MSGAPIPYLQAQLACQSAAVALRTAGPAACKLAPSSYVPLIENLERTAELLRLIQEHKAARAAEQGVRA